MSVVFACGMPNPWTPDCRWPGSPVVVQTPEQQCPHCFCKRQMRHNGKGKHLQCCKCGTHMAEKFVEAWFKILAGPDSGEGSK